MVINTICIKDNKMATFGNVTISGGLVMGSGSGTATFSPDGGTTAGTAVSLSESGGTDASVTITCSAIATWTYSRTGSGDAGATVASGGSATEITFTLLNFGLSTLFNEFTVVGTSGSVTRYWTVTLVTTGNQ